MPLYRHITLTILLSAGCSLALAEAKDTDALNLSGSLEVGAQYQSNVNISELETAAGEGDAATLVDAGLDLKWQASPRLKAQTGYSFSGKRHRQAEDFDLDIHLLFADVSYEFDPVTLGSNYYYARAQLAGDQFLTLTRYSFYAGRLFGDHWYLRGALNFSDKVFAQLPDRDADNDGFSIDNFWFFNQGRSQFTLGYSYEDENTRSRAFEYRAHSLRTSYSHRWSIFGKDTRWRLGVRWQDRDYRHVFPLIGERRADRRLVTKTQLQIQLNPHLALIARGELGDYQSNLDSADYRDNRVALSLEASF